MRKGFFALGSILLVICGYLLISIYTQLSQWGPLVAFINPEGYQTLQGIMFISIIGTLIGFVLLLYGAFSKTETAVTTPPPTEFSTSIQKKYCPYCGAENGIYAIYCIKCGKQISQSQ